MKLQGAGRLVRLVRGAGRRKNGTVHFRRPVDAGWEKGRGGNHGHGDTKTRRESDVRTHRLGDWATGRKSKFSSRNRGFNKCDKFCFAQSRRVRRENHKQAFKFVIPDTMKSWAGIQSCLPATAKFEERRRVIANCYPCEAIPLIILIGVRAPVFPDQILLRGYDRLKGDRDIVKFPPWPPRSIIF